MSTAEEHSKLGELRKRVDDCLEERKETDPRSSDDQLTRFLIAREGNVDNAFAMVRHYVCAVISDVCTNESNLSSCVEPLTCSIIIAA